MNTITQERLKELVSYDPETGVFMRKVRTSNRVNMEKPVGTVDRYGYLWCSLDGKAFRLHRLAMIYVHGTVHNGDVDHINMDRKDNRISNLREVSRSVNMQNKEAASSNNRTGYIGVCFDSRRNKYSAQIRINGKNTHLGMFDSPDVAHAAYVKAKRNFHEGCVI